MKDRLGAPFPLFLWRHFLEFIPWYVFALGALAMTHYCQSFLPFLAKELGDQLIEGKSNQVQLQTFLWVALGIVIFRTASRLLFFYPARVQQRNLRVECFEKLESTYPGRFESFSIGQIYQILFNDLGQLRGLVGFGLLQIGNVIIAAFILIPKLVEFESRYLIAFTPMLVTVVMFSVIIYRYQDAFREASVLQGESQNQIVESYDGKKTIKNFQSENLFIASFMKKCAAELDCFYRAGKGPAIASPLVKFGFGLSLIWGGYLTHQLGRESSSFILFSGFAYLFLGPLMFLSWIGTLTIRSLASWKRIQQLLALLKKVSVDEREFELPRVVDNQIIFKQSFWGSFEVFKIKQQSWSVLIGNTGEGKSTLLKAISFGLKKMGKSVHYVHQSPYLFNDTIFKNLFYSQKVEKDKIELARELLELFNLNELAVGAHDILDVEVGENGKQVSGGQAKRIALVRSLLDPSDFIVWDDPFSSVDLIMEKEIIEKLEGLELYRQRTFILSSHRLSTVKYCQHFIYLDKSVPSIKEGDVYQRGTLAPQLGEFFEKQIQ
jgi:ATP-binding cassette subfamily B protein